MDMEYNGINQTKFKNIEVLLKKVVLEENITFSGYNFFRPISYMKKYVNFKLLFVYVLMLLLYLKLYYDIY